MGRASTVTWALTLPSLLFSYLPSPLLPFPPLSPALPLEVGPFNPAMGLGERCKLPPPAGSRAEPHPKLNLVHFSFKIQHLVAINLLIFVRIN